MSNAAVLRSDTTIRLDIDGPRPPSLPFLASRLRRAGFDGWRWVAYTRSPGGHGWHVTLQLRPAPATAMEVVAVQLLLGSDPNREACVLMRARALPDTPRHARTWWNVLYQPDAARGRVPSRRLRA
jgi:hypothetical protein